ncbi:MAG: hypothetical protein ACOYJQ_04160 [Pseudochelatococcus sp.]|jgi:hypothetical protein|uniref:hypothetical protein n=1 Tax=Pseudochelatococcus sp. TaxID=2020869 RepID=UPI003D91C8A4
MPSIDVPLIRPKTHITSPHITSPRITSPRSTLSRDILSDMMTSPDPASLERFPAEWNHLIGKNLFRQRIVEHFPSREPVFGGGRAISKRRPSCYRPARAPQRAATQHKPKDR